MDFDGLDDYVALPDNEPVWLPQNMFLGSAKDMDDVVEAVAKVLDNIDEL